MTSFTIAKCESVALCRYSDTMLVIVAISGLVAIDNKFSERLLTLI